MSKIFLIYVAIMVGSLAIAMDFASVDLALPALEKQFGLDLESVQWVINGYVLAFSVLMVAGGRLADAYGRKRIFLIGMAIFAAASLIGGAAWSGGSVIGFRVLQGVGAALLWPAMMGMACAAVGDARRSVALGLIFGTCSVGNAAGPVVGGALTEWFSWRWVLWVNVPMALLAMAVTIAAIPKDSAGDEKPANDFVGMGLLTGGLVALMLVAYQAPEWGVASPATLGLLGLAVVMLGVFPWVEKRVPEPLVPPDLMANREIRTLCFSVVAICQLFFIVLLYYTQFALKFLGDDPIGAGMRVVPFMLSYGVVSYLGGPLIARLGTRRLLVIGLICGTIAPIWMAILGPGASWLAFNASLILLGIGVGAVIPTVSSRAIETVGTDRAGLVSGITFMCQLSGSALMLAINTAIFTAVSSARLTAAFARENVTLTAADGDVVNSLMAGAGTIFSLPAFTINQLPHLAEIASDAYVFGLAMILLVSAALVGVALVLVLRFVPGK